jgi:4-cresol dehydrogenase (hydroxylating) flavoprotein subunit
MITITPDFLDSLRQELGDAAVDVSEATIAQYSRNLLPSGDRRPAGVVYPSSTAEVQTIVRLANRHRFPLYSISTGENRGLGLKSPIQPGCLIVDVGKRMNRISEIDETLCFAEIEPGVTYQQLYDELGRRGHKLMMDTTSGPPNGGIVGNTLDKGAGYSPYFDHFGMSCGFEAVLGDGRILRTADGALPGSQTWHIAKYGYGPFLDGLFLQSNFGIVTRMGVWLMPRPPAIRSFFFMFPDDEDFGEIIDLIRPLKLTNAVPSLFKVTSDLYALGTVVTYPFERTGGRTPLPDEVRRELQREHGVGAWCVSGAFYGASDELLMPLVERMKVHFGRSGKARYVSHEEAQDNHILKIHIDTFTGTPTTSELGLLNWRPGGGNCWFLPAMPMIGAVADRQQALSRRILREHRLEFITEYVCGPRMARALHVIVFDRRDQEECQRVTACYRALMKAYAEAGYPISRAPLDFQEEAMARLETLPDVCSDIKRALDPHGILSPGRYGIK